MDLPAFRTFDTSNSDQALLAALSGNGIRELEFAGALKQQPNLLLSAAHTELAIEEWMQATIGTMMLNAPTGPVFIDLGPDTADQASHYISLFDIQSTGAQRLLRFGLSNVSTGPASVVLLANTSTGPQTNAHVRVGSAGVTSTGAQQVMFNAANGAGNINAGYGIGTERLVLLSALTTTPGSEAVLFSVLPYSL